MTNPLLTGSHYQPGFLMWRFLRHCWEPATALAQEPYGGLLTAPAFGPPAAVSAATIPLPIPSRSRQTAEPSLTGDRKAFLLSPAKQATACPLTIRWIGMGM